MEERPVGLFDMDGTLCDYMGQLRKGMEVLMAPGEGPYEDLYDESKPWLKARMDLIKSVPGWWRNLPLLRLGIDVFNLAQELQFDIEILTKGPLTKRRAWMEKCEWIDMHFPDTPVTINVVGRNKARYYGRFLCEDYPSYLTGWLEHRPRGLGILIDNPQNKGFDHPNVIRYNGSNLAEVEKHLSAVKARKPGAHWRNYL